ncbi:MAG: hypothetical protein JEZ09_01990 [Salinivirgaceae bacterium]|nr:hypothetical protein [Salinivirgaceae bacterium]
MNKKLNINIFLSGIVFFFITIVLSYSFLGINIIDVEWVLGQSFVIVFFFSATTLFYKYSIQLSSNTFIISLLFISVVIKVLALLFSYYYFIEVFNFPLLGKSDAYQYHKYSKIIAESSLNIVAMTSYLPLSDQGAYFYFSSIYKIFGANIFIVGLVNVFFAIHSVFLFYKTIRVISKENVARLSAIVFSFIPILNYYIGLHLKEIFFIWLIIYGTYLIIIIFETKRRSIINLILLLIIGLSLFAFRTVVGLSFFASLAIYLLFSSKIQMSFFVKFISLIIILFSLVFFMLTTGVSDESEMYYGIAERGTSYTEVNLGKTSVFKSFVGLPFQVFIMLTGPYPNLVDIKNDKHYGITRYALISDCFIKSFLGFFFLIAIIRKRVLQNNIFITSFLLIYMLILAIGGFGLLYRMFLPILPFYIFISILGLQFFIKRRQFAFYVYIFIFVGIYLFFNYSKG